jgi:hypothetical protein
MSSGGALFNVRRRRVQQAVRWAMVDDVDKSRQGFGGGGASLAFPHAWTLLQRNHVGYSSIHGRLMCLLLGSALMRSSPYDDLLSQIRIAVPPNCLTTKYCALKQGEKRRYTCS